jgi:hypothetical protein
VAHVELLTTIAGVKVRRRTGERAFYFASGMTIDADGAPKAYHPDGSPPGLDHLANAGHSGDWWGIVAEGGSPVVQRAGDPAPGFYVSTTSLMDSTKAVRDPRRYVNSSKVPFVALPKQALRAGGARLGDLAAVWNRLTDERAFAIVADVGPAGKIGEGSIALARALGIPHSPKTGGQSGEVGYVVFARSGNGAPRSPKAIKTLGAERFDEWGGLDRLRHAVG